MILSLEVVILVQKIDTLEAHTWILFFRAKLNFIRGLQHVLQSDTKIIEVKWCFKFDVKSLVP